MGIDRDYDRLSEDDRDLVEVWCNQNGAHCFEGDSGLAKLEKLVKVLGYRGNGFKYGDPIQEFLSDNPGACGAIVEFIREYVDRNPEWREAMRDEVGPEEEDEEEGEEA